MNDNAEITVDCAAQDQFRNGPSQIAFLRDVPFQLCRAVILGVVLLGAIACIETGAWNPDSKLAVAMGRPRSWIRLAGGFYRV